MTGNKNIELTRSLVSRTAILALIVLFGTDELRPQVQHAAQTHEVLTVEGMRADIAIFRDDFLARDQTYSAEARDEAEARLSELEGTLEEVSPAEFELRLAQIVSLADNGHTMSFAGGRSGRFNRVEIRLTPFGEDFYVLRATSPNADLLGARVVAVGGTSIAEIRDASRTLVGGIPEWRDRIGNYLIESPEQMHALGLIEEAAGASYEFETIEGERIVRYLAGDAPDGNRPQGGSGRWMYPELLDEEHDEWRSLLDPEDAPWSLQDPDESFRTRDLAEIDATVVELRRNHDAPGRPIRRVVRELAETIEAAGRTNLVLDMRPNGGGDLNTTRNFMESLHDLVPGHIFVLMSPWTFSAAISSIGYLEQTAPERVTLIGEGPGDRLEFFSEGSVVRLPNSGVGLLYATERHDYRTGCEGKSDCHGNVVRHPIAVSSLAPDIEAPWTIDAYAAGRDPGMEAVVAALSDQQ